MGIKKKWKDNADENVAIYLESIAEIMRPCFKINGTTKGDGLTQYKDIAYVLALLLNCRFIASENDQDIGFGADDVIPVKIEIEEHKRMKYWGKIYWLSLPKGHESFRSFQDPFYGEFELTKKGLEIVKMMFGDYDKTDLDNEIWVNKEIDWMYDV